ncbi:MAG: DNA topoisomerase IV subunit A [Desulfobulbaceae bacterium]|jgi:topoisomerase-4 subunit A|nr:DNA topoisomerase IV subunit A [Desulfobulbaceae bacterium]
MEGINGALHRLFDENFLEYTSYVIRDRAIPAIEDGLKPVQRRILQTLFNMDDGRFHKVANVVGETMKLHPHGDASIFSALVNLANKEFLIERQGNFGNIFTGDQASAARYIECRLTPLAKEILFYPELTEFIDSYDGRMQEPVALPAKLPLLLLMGAEGIAVGMATKILPHNFNELLQAQIAILRGEDFKIFPDFPQKGFLDVGDYQDGNGKVRIRAKIESKDDKTVIIREIPFGTTTQSLTDSIEKVAKAGKIKIVSINDYTAEDVEIEIKLARGIHAQETIDALYAYTDCEISISPNLTLIRGNNPAVLSVSEVLRFNTTRLVALLTRELEIELGHLREKLHVRTLERIFIEERIYKKIEEIKAYNEIINIIAAALQEFAADLPRPATKDDIEKLLEIRIKRISRFDIERQKKEIREIEKNIRAVEKSLRDTVGHSISYLEKLIADYGADCPRRTEIRHFSEIDVREVALANLHVAYNSESGFLGFQVKAEENGMAAASCSEYDKVLLIFTDGLYKVVNVPEKIFVGHDLAWFGRLDKEQVFNIIYRDGKENVAYIKRCKTPAFILDKEYRLFPEHARSKLALILSGDEKHARIYLTPSSRARSHYVDVHFDEIPIKGVAAIGKRASNRAMRRAQEITAKAAPPAPLQATLPGVLGENDPNPDKESDE